MVTLNNLGWRNSQYVGIHFIELGIFGANYASLSLKLDPQYLRQKCIVHKIFDDDIHSQRLMRTGALNKVTTTRKRKFDLCHLSCMTFRHSVFTYAQIPLDLSCHKLSETRSPTWSPTRSATFLFVENLSPTCLRPFLVVVTFKRTTERSNVKTAW